MMCKEDLDTLMDWLDKRAVEERMLREDDANESAYKNPVKEKDES